LIVGLAFPERHPPPFLETARVNRAPWPLPEGFDPGASKGHSFTRQIWGELRIGRGDESGPSLESESA
jgi:hypothetical protein